MNNLIGYTHIDSPIHKLTGASKLIFLVFWTLASMITYDTRIRILMFIFSLIAFKMSKVKFKQISFVLYFILIFLLINNIAIFAFSPYEGVGIYNSRTELFTIFGPYKVTLEQVFYQFNISIKYFSIIPIALMFIVTTNPSEFAASLNKVGVNYKIAYAVSIALRYIPDIQKEYHEISFAQQARGIDMSKKEKISKRLKNSTAIIMPLIFSSLERIDTISSAMELRAFGNNKKRTWYNEKDFEKNDYICILISCIIFIIVIVGIILNKGRFFNPFS